MTGGWPSLERTRMTRIFRRRCASPIEMLVLDVDGVLTDGGIVYGDGGDEIKAFHVRDGSGLQALAGGRANAPASSRAGRSWIVAAPRTGHRPRSILQGAADKLAGSRGRPWPIAWPRARSDLLRRRRRPDLGALGAAGLAAAVADACAEAQARAHYVTAAGGGRGASARSSS